MGALLSGGVGLVAIPIARLLGIRKQQKADLVQEPVTARAD